MTPKEIQNKLNEAVMNIQSLQAELDKLKSNLSEIPNSSDHLLPDGYEFCDNDKAELFLQVSAIQESQNQDIGTLVQSLPNSPYDALYKGVRKIQYNISIHERFAL